MRVSDVEHVGTGESAHVGGEFGPSLTGRTALCAACEQEYRGGVSVGVIRGGRVKYVQPGRPGSIVSVQLRHDNFIGGKWLTPPKAAARAISALPTRSRSVRSRSTAAGIELALDTAYSASPRWRDASTAERAKRKS